MARWTVIACGLALVLFGPRPGHAQTTTLLHLSAAGTVAADPDELVADLAAQNTQASAAAAQRRVNGMVAEAMKVAASVAGVDAKAAGYAVTPTDEKRVAWTAQQTVDLRSADGPALLDLVGTLQGRGLVVESLDWQLSAAKRLAAHETATEAALKALQTRAAAAAAVLGMQVDHIQEVRLDDSGIGPRPFMRAMASGGTAPQATAAREDVTATVSADIVLRR
jgi:uncharacterized protein YggE